MSFSHSRFNKKIEWELIRYSCELNSFIAGGAQKLFKAFILKYSPSSIISYCDRRFASFDYNETFYPKLGFKYIGNSQISYKYIDPETNRIYSRMKFQKHKLEKELKDYDANLSEADNMKKNGYIRVYDCGNFIFKWNKED